MKYLISIIISLLGFSLKLQATNLADSVVVSFDAYLDMVKAYHPIGKQADLLLESGDANLRKARGSFDPILKSMYDNKQFDEKNYYQLNSAKNWLIHAKGKIHLSYAKLSIYAKYKT